MRLIEMVLIVSQLDLHALSKFNYPAFILIVLAIASDLAKFGFICGETCVNFCSIIKYKVDLQKYFNLWSGLLKIAI